MSILNQPLSLIAIRPSRTIGDIQVNVVINESTTDTLTITKQPVQQGASIIDHAYLEPTVFSHTIYFSANLTLSLDKIYQQLLTLQASRIPFDIITPKRIYKSMLMTTLANTTDKNTENILSIAASYEQIIIVPITTTSIPRTQQRAPKKTAPTQPAGNKSAPLNVVQGVAGFFGKFVPGFSGGGG